MLKSLFNHFTSPTLASSQTKPDNSGAFKEPQKELSEPIICEEPWPLTKNDKGNTTTIAPILDCRAGISIESLTSHILQFISWYYQIKPEKVTLTAHLYEDIERAYYARHDNVSMDKVVYRCLQGLNDYGLTILTLIGDLADSIGLTEIDQDGIFYDIDSEDFDVQRMVDLFVELLDEYGVVNKHG